MTENIIFKMTIVYLVRLEAFYIEYYT